ncbi:MAG: hypothetical protein IPM29_29115 [Planctomycetes bacterium]|nr:hypothetical protein [Planctomycetota bacterium]
MSIDGNLIPGGPHANDARVGRVQAPGTERTDGARPSGDGATFRRILEQLEAVAKRADAEPTASGDDVQALQDALRLADEDHQQLMELRARLEDAFRRATE